MKIKSLRAAKASLAVSSSVHWYFESDSEEKPTMAGDYKNRTLATLAQL